MSKPKGGQVIEKIIKIKPLNNGDRLCNIYFWQDFFKCSDTSGVSHRFKKYGLSKYGHKCGDGHKYWSERKVLSTIFG